MRFWIRSDGEGDARHVLETTFKPLFLSSPKMMRNSSEVSFAANHDGRTVASRRLPWVSRIPGWARSLEPRFFDSSRLSLQFHHRTKLATPTSASRPGLAFYGTPNKIGRRTVTRRSSRTLQRSQLLQHSRRRRIPIKTERVPHPSRFGPHCAFPSVCGTRALAAPGPEVTLPRPPWQSMPSRWQRVALTDTRSRSPLAAAKSLLHT
ncbi:hypothetical protein HDK77DRAFT_318624 [Phyllosticta capitalensis]